jgi:NRAMP (natural resistance-associated macrophage protein)-like metal ion transporter
MPAPSISKSAGRIGALRSKLLLALTILGPGFITANADNDVGSILTYSQAGARFGYSLLWTLVPITVALIVVQEMAARLGVGTGKGLARLVREQNGLPAALVVVLCLSLGNFGNIMAEFAGLASGMEMFGVSRYLAVPLGVALLLLIIVRGGGNRAERALFLLSMVYFVYPVAAVLAHPDWRAALHDTFVPKIAKTSDYLVMIVALTGSTVSPWMQSYLQSAVVESGINAQQYELGRWDTILGCITSNAVGFFVITVCAATLHRGVGQEAGITNVAEAAAGLWPVAGRGAFLLFAAGLINGALLSAALLPVAVAYDLCETLGLESGLNKRLTEAPLFYGLFVALLAGAAALVLIPGLPPLKVIFLSQVANGVLLPIQLWLMLRLVNNSKLMGDLRNSRFQNVVAYSTTIVLVGLTGVLLWTTFRS